MERISYAISSRKYYGGTLDSLLNAAVACVCKRDEKSGKLARLLDDDDEARPHRLTEKR